MTTLRLRRRRPGSPPSGTARRAIVRVLPAVLLTVLALGGLARPAAAQPGSGVPRPISAAEINEFAERLGLTPAQRAAIDPIHDAYRADFERLRTRVIEPFLAQQRRMSMGGPSVTRATVEELLDEGERVMTRVAGLDARFFDQLVPLLTAEQAAMLPRVRMARERMRSQAGGMGFMLGGTGSGDLSSIVAGADLRLTAEQARQVDAVLEPYERRLTRRMSELDDSARTMMLRVVEIMDEAGFLGVSQEEMMSDPERMRDMMDVAEEAFSSAGAEVQEIAGDILELNVDTHDRVLRMLPAPAAWELRRAFLTQGLPLGAALVANPPSEPWHAASRIRDLDPELREQVLAGLRAAMDAEQPRFDEVIERIVDAQSAIGTADMSGFQEIGRLTEELRTEMVPRHREAQERVTALLGDDWRQRVAVAGEAEAAEGEAAGAGMPGGGRRGFPVAEAGREDPDASDRVVGDPFVPARMGTRTLERMATRTGVTEDDRPILEALHRDYVEAFEALPEVDAVREAWRDRWDREREATEVERARRLNAARRAAHDAIGGLEARFFDDLETTFGDGGPRSAAIERERLARRIDRLIGSGGSRSATARGGGGEGDVDLVELVRTVELDPADRVVAATALAPRLEAAVEVAERLFAARLAVQVGEAEWRMALGTVDGEDPLAFQDVYASTMGGPSERLEAVRTELAAFNRQGAEAILAALDGDARRTFQAAWRRAAFPQVYDDPMCVLPHYERAMELEDLDAAQRDELAAGLASYRGEWERLSEEMVEQLRSVDVDFSQWAEIDWNEVQQVNAELERLGLARSDHSVRAANALRLVLREDQLARLGGLPDPDDERIPNLFAF